MNQTVSILADRKELKGVYQMKEFYRRREQEKQSNTRFKKKSELVIAKLVISFSERQDLSGRLPN